MIIDCHAHLYRENPEDTNHCFVGEPFGALPLERFTEHAQKQPVDRMVLSVFQDTKTAQGLAEANRVTADAVEAYPDFFSGLCAVNPLLVEESLECMEAHVANGPLAGLGEICQYIQGHATDDPGMVPILERAAELEIPVLMHSSTQEHSDALGGLAQQFPKVRFVMAHMGGMHNWHRGIETARQHDNIWAGTSGPVVVYCGALERALDRLGAGRILFGSDFPLTNAGPFLAALGGAGLKSDDYERITAHNSAELFGIQI